MADGNGTKPLVTFFVIAYNQSRFIREAVESALSQTYRPMEILLSDDCSTDGTFEIIADLARTYSGPHSIVVNRNERNLGLSEHLNRILELASGELIIAADGDDISVSRRTDRCVDVWLKHGRPAALASSVSCIDAAGHLSQRRNGLQWFSQFFPEEGRPNTENLLRFGKNGSPRLVSCSAAWTKSLCNAFGPLPKGIWFEDDIISLRAWLFDRIVFIPEALVRYREHDANIHNRVPVLPTTCYARRRSEQAARVDARRRRDSLAAYASDLDLAARQGWITRSVCEEIERDLDTRSKLHKIMEEWWAVGWTKRVGSLFFLLRSGRTNEARWCAPRLLPFPLFLASSAMWSRKQWFIRFGAQRARPVSPRRTSSISVPDAAGERSTSNLAGTGDAAGKHPGIDSGTLRVVLRDS